MVKRFYREVTFGEVPVGEVAGAPAPGYQVLLDGRPIRTQGGAAQIAPTRALAEALAGEWRGQGPEIDPRSFPLRDLADYAIDHVAPARQESIAKLLGYAETDTLCYRADPDEPLYQRQQELWEPLVAACEAAHGIRIERISGIVHRSQPEAMIAALRTRLATLDDFTLAGMITLASLAASLFVALSVLEERGAPGALFAAANLEEDWQAQQWGWDSEAEKVRTAREEAFCLAARFISLARKA